MWRSAGQVDLDHQTTTGTRYGGHLAAVRQLGRGEVTPIVSRADGTVTWLPEVGAVVRRGGVLLRVDDRPVVLLLGKLPMYRALSTGVEGPDVTQLEKSLQALGYDSFTVDVKAGEAGWAKSGVKVTVTLPGGRSAEIQVELLWHVLTRPLRSPVSVNPLEPQITAGAFRQSDELVRTEEFTHPGQCAVEARQRLRVGTVQSHPSQYSAWHHSLLRVRASVSVSRRCTRSPATATRYSPHPPLE